MTIDPTFCRATSKVSGRQCGRRPIPGGTVCRYHGGAAPQTLAAARRRLAREKVEEMVRTLGVAVEVDPGEALLAMVHEAAGNVAFLRELVMDLEARLTQVDYGPGRAERETEAAVVKMYADERERLAKFSKMAIDAGIAEREVRIAEAHAHALGRVLTASFDDPALGLTREQREIAREVAAKHMRFIASAQERQPAAIDVTSS